MYINHLMTDRELIETAQYAENPHLRLLAERLKDKLRLIKEAKRVIDDVRPGYEDRALFDVEQILNR